MSADSIPSFRADATCLHRRWSASLRRGLSPLPVPLITFVGPTRVLKQPMMAQWFNIWPDPTVSKLGWTLISVVPRRDECHGQIHMKVCQTSHGCLGCEGQFVLFLTHHCLYEKSFQSLVSLPLQHYCRLEVNVALNFYVVFRPSDVVQSVHLTRNGRGVSIKLMPIQPDISFEPGSSPRLPSRCLAADPATVPCGDMEGQQHGLWSDGHLFAAANSSMSAGTSLSE